LIRFITGAEVPLSKIGQEVREIEAVDVGQLLNALFTYPAHHRPTGMHVKEPRLIKVRAFVYPVI
jgi:hypothetical protein